MYGAFGDVWFPASFGVSGFRRVLGVFFPVSFGCLVSGEFWVSFFRRVLGVWSPARLEVSGFPAGFGGVWFAAWFEVSFFLRVLGCLVSGEFWVSFFRRVLGVFFPASFGCLFSGGFWGRVFGRVLREFVPKLPLPNKAGADDGGARLFQTRPGRTMEGPSGAPFQSF